jgi:hypothetical protein
MSRKVTEEEFLAAASHLRDVVRLREPQLGFKQGQARGPEDREARLTVLQGLVDKFDRSLLHRLLKDVNPIATRRIFNELLDGKRTYAEAMDEATQRSLDSGRKPEAIEWMEMSLLFDEALMIQNNSTEFSE